MNSKAEKALTALEALQPQIAMAHMLIELGVTTVEMVKGYFRSNVSDEEVLAGILAEVDARIARRS